MEKSKLDLETLKHVKFMFDIHSDFSTQCNGYKSICRMIKTKEDEMEMEEYFAELEKKGHVKFYRFLYKIKLYIYGK